MKLTKYYFPVIVIRTYYFTTTSNTHVKNKMLTREPVNINSRAQYMALKPNNSCRNGMIKNNIAAAAMY